jgi:hypothetical protein
MRLNHVRVIAGERCVCGVVGAFRSCCREVGESEIVVEVEVFLESRAVEGKSPVDVRRQLSSVFPSSTGPLKSCVNLAGPPAKPKYFLVTDSGTVP